MRAAIALGWLGLLLALLCLTPTAAAAASPPLARLSGVLQPSHALVESQSASGVGPHEVVKNAFAIAPVPPATRHLDQLRKGVVQVDAQKALKLYGEQARCRLRYSQEKDAGKQAACIAAVADAWNKGQPLAVWMDWLLLRPVQTLVSETTNPAFARVHPRAKPRFTYVLDAAGRVTRAMGDAFVGPASSPIGAGKVYYETLREGAALGERNNFAAGGVSGVWSQGHIIAAQLGGSNTEPLNFFLQRQVSNNSGRYYLAEELAAAYLANIRTGRTAATCVKVDVSFAYNGAQWIPHGGTYTVSVNPTCLQGNWAWGNAALVNGLRVFATQWAQDETVASLAAGQLHAIQGLPTVV